MINLLYSFFINAHTVTNIQNFIVKFVSSKESVEMKISVKTGKNCTGCKVYQNYSLFSKNSHRRDGYQNICKKCSSANSKLYYISRKPILIAMINAKRAERRAAIQELVANYLKINHCVDCGEDDMRSLQFDHIRDKKKDISQMIKDGSAKALVLEEISKCLVRCASCHQIKTSERNNDWRHRYHKKLVKKR